MRKLGQSWKDEIQNHCATRILATFPRQNPCGTMVLHKTKENQPKKPQKTSCVFFLSTAHRRTGPNRPRQARNPADVGTMQAKPASTSRGPSTQGCPESSQLSEPAWWLHANFGRRPFPWKQFIQAVSAGGQATHPCQSIPEGGGKRDSMVPKSGNTIRQIGPSELQPGRNRKVGGWSVGGRCYRP